MPTITQLPDHLIAQIAAGEVIERPAYAVKELVENAIDAGADTISVAVEESGLRKITVSDNGKGLSAEDLELAMLPHTTSKLHSLEQLHSLQSYGFRGEALSSIAAISHTVIQSRLQSNPGGTSIESHAGEISSQKPVGMPHGTIVTVNHLFASVPVRKKFLKSAQTEFRHILDVMTQFSLVYPSIHFSLTHNKKVIFDLPKKETNTERIQSLLGTSLFEQLLPVSEDENYIQITGFIGRPQIASKQNQKQFLFINNRIVTDKIISLAVKEAYGSLLPAPSSPVFILHIQLPYELVDVNVHPRKEQIALINSKHIFDTVKSAVKDVLQRNNLTFHLATFTKDHSARTGETTSFAGNTLREAVLRPEKLQKDIILADSPYLQIDKTYILVITKDGMQLFDQHAVHERILYEKFTTSFLEQQKKNESYELPLPTTITLSLSEISLLEEHNKIFKNLGFIFDFFHTNSIVVRSVPSIFKGRNTEKIVREFLSDLQTDRGASDIDTRTKRMLAFLSCRAAVKAGDSLTEKEMKQFIKTLEGTENNATCPHGRPTKILFPLTLLHKEFKRQ